MKKNISERTMPNKIPSNAVENQSEMFTIIDIQEDFVVVDKKHNVNFHDEDNLGYGLFNAVKKWIQLKDSSTISSLYPVHRLDKMTSGLLIFARNLATAQHFQELFSEHRIEKYYLAISDKKPKKKQGLIKGDMEKGRRGSWKLIRRFENPAISQFFSYARTDGKRLFLIKPHSGKSHQIRVALSSIGAPILGDVRYYGTLAKNSDRGYLHAYGIKFEFKDQYFQYILPPTKGDFFVDDITAVQLSTLQSPWLLNWPKV